MTTLAQIIIEHYQTSPEKTSVIVQRAGQTDRTLSYQAVVHGANQYARTYQRMGVQPGQVVVLILQHGEDLLYAFWGAILAGIIPSIMPFLTEKLSPERYRTDLSSLISITRPTAIVTYAEFEQDVRNAFKPGGSVQAVILTSQIDAESSPDFSEMPGLRRAPQEIALLQHSSGTTGLQKGVALSHLAILNQLQAYRATLLLGNNDIFVSWLPLYHDMGLIAGFLMPILLGNQLVLLSPFDWVRAPYRLFQAVSQYRGTLSWLPNFALNFCVQKIRDRDIQGVDLSSWRTITNCSEPIKWSSYQAFYERFKTFGLPATALNCSYAMAENVFGVTQTPSGTQPVIDEIDREAYINSQVVRPAEEGKPCIRMMSSGRLLANTQLSILDEGKNPLPDRCVGEIALQSNCLLTGYFNRPDITEKAFHNSWYLTGDYGYTLNGEVFVIGRKKDLIIVGGKNIYPQDLETLACEIPGIHAGRAVAFGIENEQTGTEEVVIVAEVDTDDEGQKQQIADALRKHIAQNSAIVLRHAHLVSNKWIIKTSSGKTARSANREKFLKESDNIT
jgi:acyl-CoA synthetase (AMP-forming)/AMP-acid ligase II